MTPLPTITIWTKPACSQCEATKRAFVRRGLQAGLHYEVRSLTDDLDALTRFKSMGMLSAPVVEAFGTTWGGFRPDLILSAAEQASALHAQPAAA